VEFEGLHRLYCQNRKNAAKRGIPDRLTFRQWLDVWGQFILDEHRGAGDDRLRLERKDKRLGFEAGNVHLARRMMPARQK
jgi:hypothetical protein